MFEARLRNIKKLSPLFLLAIMSIGGFAQKDSPVTNDAPRKRSACKAVISSCVLAAKIRFLGIPPYPAMAAAVGASGVVNVEVLIDEEGNVVEAKAISGHPFLRPASVRAAMESKFEPVSLSAGPMKIKGLISYRYVGKIDWFDLGKNLGKGDLKMASDMASQLPWDYSSEMKLLEKIRIENSCEELAYLIESIRSKLFDNFTSRTEFNLGVALGKIRRNISNDLSLRTQLLQIKEYLDLHVLDSSPRLDNLRKLADFINNQSYDWDDQREILALCQIID